MAFTPDFFFCQQPRRSPVEVDQIVCKAQWYVDQNKDFPLAMPIFKRQVVCVP